MIKTARRTLALSAAMAALATVSGCASLKDEYRMLPTGDHGVGVRFSRGNAAMISNGVNASVMVLPIRYNSANRLYFSVTALNTAGRPINFGTEDVTVVVDDRTRVRVQDYNIMRQQLRVQAQRELNEAWMAAAIDGFLAYQSADWRSDRMGYAFRRANGSYSFSREMIEQRLHYSAASLGRTVLQTSTIDPGTAHSGWVYADQLVVPDDVVRRLTILVNLGGEDHVFGVDLAATANEVGVRPNIPAVPKVDYARVAGARETYQFSDPAPVVPMRAPIR